MIQQSAFHRRRSIEEDHAKDLENNLNPPAWCGEHTKVAVMSDTVPIVLCSMKIASQADESDHVYDAKMVRVWVNPRTFSSRDALYAEEHLLIFVASCSDKKFEAQPCDAEFGRAPNSDASIASMASNVGGLGT